MASYAESKYGLKGYRCLVTGGTKGIGAAVVEELASLGATVFTCARSEQDLDARLEEWRSKGLQVHGCVADVSDRNQRQALVNAAVEALNAPSGEAGPSPSGLPPQFNKGLDLLVNNVGFNIRKPTLEYTEEDYQRLMATNLESAYHLCQICHPFLSRNTPPAPPSSSTSSKSGEQGDVHTEPPTVTLAPSPPPFTSSIIFNSSVAGGPTAMWSGTIYAMTKASMNQLAKNLACEWAKDGIRVNSVSPWYTATPLAQQVLKDETLRKEVLDRTPMKRVGEPQEVASVMAFLASKAASYITGQNVHVDGGYSVMGYYRP